MRRRGPQGREGNTPPGTTPPEKGGALAHGLRLSVGTLTAFPVPPPRRVDRRVAGVAMVLAPLAVLPVAAACALGAWLLYRADAPPMLVGALVLVALALSTRGMHLDGLADLADGLSASFDRARSLEVMKRSDSGPSGVAAIVLVLLVQAAALSGLVGSVPGIVTVAVAVLTSRQALAWACRRGVPAASEGGLGATVAGSVPPASVTASTLVLLLVAAGAGLLAGDVWAPLSAAAAGVVGGLAVVARARARLGGITGDVLGAVIEVAVTAALVVGAVVTGAR